MAIDGGGRNCGVHELICARRVSPELLGVLSSIAAFMVLMAVFFLYLSNKLSVESPDDLSHLGGYKSNQPVTILFGVHARVGLSTHCDAGTTPC
ncbi:Synaptotagmin-14 [Larimichthys crocea]|uniref:Uncharacterized protein n=1 Tax=Larimichthys crocea TaxID=215358 RepID=A0ACD3QZA1_LARCR|nr:Synaptotagmin-14 [Larimichthys crocea]